MVKEDNKKRKSFISRLIPLPGGNMFFQHSFLIFISRFFPAFSNLCVLLYFSRKLDKSLYGDYQNFWIQYYLFYPIVCLGIHLWMVTYSRQVIIETFSRIRAKFFVFYAVLVFVFSSVFGILQYHTPKQLFLVPFLFLLITPVVTILESFLVISQRFVVLVSVNVVYAVLFFWVHWYFIHHTFSLTLLFGSILLVLMVKTIFFLIDGVAIYRKGLRQNKDKSAILSAGSGKLLIHIGLFDLLQMLSNSVDKFIISIMLPASQSAIYYIGSQNVPFLPMLLSSSGNAVLMQLADVKKTEEKEQILHLMNKLGVVLSGIIFPVFCFLAAFRYEFITILFTGKYQASVPVFLFTTLALPLRAYSFNIILQKLHKGDIINKGSFAELILAILLMFPMYRMMGLVGVALTFTVTTYLLAAYYLFQTAKLLQVKMYQLIPLRNWIIKLVIFGLFFFISHYMLSVVCSAMNTLIAGTGMLAVTVLVTLWVQVKVKSSAS